MSQRRKAESIASAFSSPGKKPKQSNSIPPSPQLMEVTTNNNCNAPVRAPSISNRSIRNGDRSLSINKHNIKTREKESTFNDPIHGNITMDGLCLRIIDTKEFQRLRKLMQLGTCNYVFYGATHTRFEHSIGVSHFAGKVVQNLQTSQPHLNITDIDILCVKVAGLCHDLGHGPFSHVFDGVFIPRIDPNTSWRHEDGSVQMLRHLMMKNKIHHSEYNLTDQDFLFIEEIIAGTSENNRRGRSYEKFYLYDIVNNSRSGLDVDKLDYFMRDMRYTNASSSTCNFQRFIELGRVYPAEPIETSTTGRRPFENNSLPAEQEPYMICYPEKMVKEALDVFAVRFRLHQTIYTHKSVKKVEFMITDALVLANEIIRIPGSVTETHPDGLYRMSDCVTDPAALSNLNDQVLTLIELSNDPRLSQAQELLRKVQNRQFYTCLGKTTYTRDSPLFRATASEIEDMILRCAEEISVEAQRRQAEREQRRLNAGTDSLLSQDGYHNSGNSSMMDPYSAAGLASPDPWRFIQSQDSAPDDHYYSQEDIDHTNTSMPASLNSIVLQKGDIIIDKMHIHYGKKQHNPVENMRFYSKGAEPVQTAKKVSEDVYQTLLPRSFEELAVRIFCREKNKERIALKAFARFCKASHIHLPFPSQMEEGGGNNNDDQEEDGEEEERETRQFAHIMEEK